MRASRVLLVYRNIRIYPCATVLRHRVSQALATLDTGTAGGGGGARRGKLPPPGLVQQRPAWGFNLFNTAAGEKMKKKSWLAYSFN